MKRFLFSLLIVVVFINTAFQCGSDPIPGSCSVPAIVRDLTNLDGCGFVFELNDGTRLIPVWEWGWCGTPPLPQGATEDPLYNFEFWDGRAVLIEYTERTDFATICMAGKTVKITCIKEGPFPMPTN